MILFVLSSRRQATRLGYRQGRFDARHDAGRGVIALHAERPDSYAAKEVREQARKVAETATAQWRDVFRAAYSRGFRGVFRTEHGFEVASTADNLWVRLHTIRSVEIRDAHLSTAYELLVAPLLITIERP